MSRSKLSTTYLLAVGEVLSTCVKRQTEGAFVRFRLAGNSSLTLPALAGH